MRCTPEQAAEAISLHNRMTAALAQMAVLPYGTVMNYNGNSGRSSEHPGGRRPAGEALSEEDKYRARWQGCRTIRAARLVVEEAEAELEHWRHAKRVEVKEENWQQLARRICATGSGWSAEDVAQALKVTVSQVRRARVDAKLHPETGKEPRVAVILSTEERKARVNALAADGWLAKNIAKELGVAYKTVLRDLDEAEKAA